MFPGFPPPDNAIRQLLTGTMEEKVEKHLMLHFLTVLFEKTKSVLDSDLKGANSRSERITKFREFMAAGQEFGRVGHERQTFYEDVVREVKKVSHVYRLSLISFYILFYRG